MGAVVGFLLSRMELWLVAAIAYFCGCFNGAVIISKYILRDDVRTHGSGNAGLTNFYRTFGGPLTLVVILCDVLKAVVAILIAAKIGSGFVWWSGSTGAMPSGFSPVRNGSSASTEKRRAQHENGGLGQRRLGHGPEPGSLRQRSQCDTLVP